MYPVGYSFSWPVTKVRGRPRKRHVPDSLSTAAEDMLASAQWRTVSWRSGTQGSASKARFAAVRVRTADGPPQRIWDEGQQHLPGDEAWLIGERRASGEERMLLSRQLGPPGMDLRSLAATIRGTMDVRGQAHQQLKGELWASDQTSREGLGNRPSSSCADGDDCLRVPPTSPAQKSEAERKMTAPPPPATDVAGGSPRHRRPHHAIKS